MIGRIEGGKARLDKGFSFVEALVALLIVTMVSVIIATGVPSAINAYRNTVASSNAQIALSTLTTVLRDELGSATSVTLEASGNKVQSYRNSASGSLDCTITCEGDSPSPIKTVLAASAGAGATNTTWTLIPDAQLASAQGSLLARFDEIDYDGHVFKIVNLCIYDENNHVLARVGEKGNSDLAIRAPFCTVSTST